MYRGLTANTPGCVAFSLPVQRRNLRNLEIPASFRSLRSQRSARLTRSGGFQPPRGPGPGHYLVSGTAFRHGITDYPGLYGPDSEEPASALALAKAFSDRQGGVLPPTCSDGPTLDAPDCEADHDPGKNRADAERKLRASP